MPALYADRYGVPAYENYHDMLLKEPIDVVSILTPSGMHPTHAMDIMQRYGVHVVIEKPMALALADVAAMRAVAVKAGVKIFPVYQNRYNKAVQCVRRALEAGALGKPVLGTVRVRWSRGPAYYARDPWRGTWAMDGGARPIRAFTTSTCSSICSATSSRWWRRRRPGSSTSRSKIPRSRR